MNYIFQNPIRVIENLNIILAKLSRKQNNPTLYVFREKSMKKPGTDPYPVPGYVMVGIQFYNPYAAIPAAAERQISRIGDMPPFFIFLDPKYIAPSTIVSTRGRISIALF